MFKRKNRRVFNSMLFPFSDPLTGGLSSLWESGGSTWAADANGAYNTPTPGTDLMVDGDMEAAGVASWILYQPGTLAKVLTPVHGGTQSMQYTSAGTPGGVYQATALTPQNWYYAEAWARWNSAITGNTISIASLWNNYGRTFTDATQFIPFRMIFLQGALFNGYMQIRGNTGFDVFIDDWIMYQLTHNQMYLTVYSGMPDVTVTGKVTIPTQDSGCNTGLVACLDSVTNPRNCITLTINGGSASQRLFLDKQVNGVWTSLINTTITYVAAAPVKIVKSGVSVSAYYNGIQIGTTQTVSDPTVVNNGRHGVLSGYQTPRIKDFSIA